MRERMQEHFAIEENAQKQKESMKYSMRLKRAKDANHMSFEHDGYDSGEDALLASLNIDESKKRFSKAYRKMGIWDRKICTKLPFALFVITLLLVRKKYAGPH